MWHSHWKPLLRQRHRIQVSVESETCFSWHVSKLWDKSSSNRIPKKALKLWICMRFAISLWIVTSTESVLSSIHLMSSRSPQRVSIFQAPFQTWQHPCRIKISQFSYDIIKNLKSTQKLSRRCNFVPTLWPVCQLIISARAFIHQAFKEEVWAKQKKYSRFKLYCH